MVVNGVSGFVMMSFLQIYTLHQNVIWLPHTNHTYLSPDSQGHMFGDLLKFVTVLGHMFGQLSVDLNVLPTGQHKSQFSSENAFSKQLSVHSYNSQLYHKALSLF